MPNSKITHRHYLIIEKIGEGQYPSKEDVIYYLLNYEIVVTDRVIEKDFEKIRNDYGIEISYDNRKRGYWINKEESIDIESFTRFLEIINTADILTNSLKESRETLKNISFDTSGGLKNIKLLQPLLKAVTQQIVITFDYNKFNNSNKQSYIIEPYILKEYQNRWYIVGVKKDIGKMRTFGIDRIEDLELTKEVFKPKNNIDPISNFNQTIGLVYSDGIKAQEVVLSFSPQKGNYIKTLPLHFTQEILIDDDIEFRISLFVIPNNDLTELILKYTSSIKVIEPKWLADEVKEKLKQALTQY